MVDAPPDAYSHTEPLPLGGRSLVRLSLLAGVLLTLVAWAITVWGRGEPVAALFAGGAPLPVQLVFGVVSGAAVAVLVAAVTLKSPWFGPLRTFIQEIFEHVRPAAADMVVISLIAGFSEELLFRGALQPLIGIGWASAAFALAHVGWKVFHHGWAAYAAFLFVMSVLLGVVYENVGLVAAITAHAVYDLVILLAMDRYLMRRR